MKKNLLIVVMVILVLVCIYGIYNKNKKQYVFTDDYPEVAYNNVYEKKNINDIIKIVEHGTGVVYIGFPACPWCQKYSIYLNEAAIENKLEKVYYLDIYNDRENNTKEYLKLVTLLSDKLQYDDEGNKRIFVPTVVFVKDGEIVGYNDDTSTLSGDPAEYWTQEKIDYIKVKLASYINKVNKENCESCN